MEHKLRSDCRSKSFYRRMKTILVLSSHPDFAEAIRTSLSAEQYRVVHRRNVDEGEPLLVHGLIGACILDADLMGVECVWTVERLRRRDARTPIIDRKSVV